MKAGRAGRRGAVYIQFVVEEVDAVDCLTLVAAVVPGEVDEPPLEAVRAAHQVWLARTENVRLSRMGLRVEQAHVHVPAVVLCLPGVDGDDVLARPKRTYVSHVDRGVVARPVAPVNPLAVHVDVGLPPQPHQKLEVLGRRLVEMDGFAEPEVARRPVGRGPVGGRILYRSTPERGPARRPISVVEASPRPVGAFRRSRCVAPAARPDRHVHGRGGRDAVLIGGAEDWVIVLRGVVESERMVGLGRTDCVLPPLCPHVVRGVQHVVPAPIPVDLRPLVDRFCARLPGVRMGGKQKPRRSHPCPRIGHVLAVDDVAVRKLHRVEVRCPVPVHKQVRIDPAVEPCVGDRLPVRPQHRVRGGVPDAHGHPRLAPVVDRPVVMERTVHVRKVARMNAAVLRGGAGRPVVVHGEGVRGAAPVHEIRRFVHAAVCADAHEVVLTVVLEDPGVGHALKHGIVDGG